MSIKGVLLGVVLGVSVSSTFWHFTNSKQESVLEAGIPSEGRMLLEKEIKAVEMPEKEEISLSGQEFETMVTRIPLNQMPLDPAIQQHIAEKNKVDISTEEILVSEPQELPSEPATDMVTSPETQTETAEGQLGYFPDSVENTNKE